MKKNAMSIENNIAVQNMPRLGRPVKANEEKIKALNDANC